MKCELDIANIIRYGIDHMASQQWEAEITQFIEIVCKQRPKYIMEIGVYRGGTTYMLAKVAAQDALIIGIDTMEGYPAIWRDEIMKIPAPDQEMHLLVMDSHTTNTYNEVLRILGDNQLDILFIDNGHEYSEARADFDTYYPIVRRGGIVALHDIVVNHEHAPKSGSYGTDILWKEISGIYAYDEIIIDPEVICTGYGIGIIWK